MKKKDMKVQVGIAFSIVTMDEASSPEEISEPTIAEIGESLDRISMDAIEESMETDQIAPSDVADSTNKSAPL